MPDHPMRFGALLLPTGSWADLVRRAREAEALGFEFVWIDDHAAHPARPDAPWFEVWTALAGLAAATTRVKLGPLVANVVLRHPVVLARQARTVEQIADGRLEVGLGAGYASSDHAALGEPPWPSAERAQRFEQAVALVDALLRSRPVTSEGGFYPVHEMTLAPASPHGHRPPLAVSAHGPRALRTAARHADTWVSYGGFDLDPDEALALTRRRLDRLIRCCETDGRDPATIRRRLLAGSAALTREPIWRDPGAFDAFVERQLAAGIGELALHWPPAGVNPSEAVRAATVARIAERWFAPRSG
jgi:alkanesulfonate monooxygenase SsuD/methylene tetrahydromethanopterin reductase-like flavin-dependent oxidoreductase (luciferase family)